jgi:Cyclic nucleotide-binding domain
MRQGEAGDRYCAIAAGELTVLQDGRLLRRCRRGDGVGEIALLRGVPRTATVVAQTRATVYALGRQAFLSPVTGHATSMHRAERIVEMRLAPPAGTRRTLGGNRANDRAGHDDGAVKQARAGMAGQLPFSSLRRVCGVRPGESASTQSRSIAAR